LLSHNFSPLEILIARLALYCNRLRRLSAVPRLDPSLAQPRRSLRMTNVKKLFSGPGGFALGGAGDDPQHFLFAHDDVVFAVRLDLGGGVLAEQDAIALFHIEGANFAFLIDFAFAGGDDFALLRLFLGGVGQNDAAAGGFSFFDPTHENAIVQRGELGSHEQTPFVSY